MTVRTSDIHIDPKLVSGAARRPKMLELREAVKERFRVSDERARSIAERMLNDAVERFGVKYLNEMSAHIEQAFELREQAANIIDQVIGPEAMSPDTAATRLEGLFHDMKGHVESITGPEAFAKAQPDKVLEDIAFPSEKDLTPEGFAREKELKSEEIPRKALRTGRHTERLDLLTKRFKLLAQDERGAIRRFAEFAPRDLWKAVSSEIGPAKKGLQGGSLDSRIASLLERARTEGMNADEVASLERAVRALQDERGRNLLHGAGSAEAAVRAEGMKNLVTRLVKTLADDKKFAESLKLDKLRPKALREYLSHLRKAIAGDPYLELLAAENPRHLLALFEKSPVKTKSGLRARIRHLMVTHVRGLLGEFTAAFEFGEDGIFLLKAPDDNVTIRGTDMVGVTQRGRVWLIDNKALSVEEVESVTSLTRNIEESITEDAETASDQFGIQKDPMIGDAVQRLERTKKAIREITKDMSPKEVADPKVQRQIAAICARNKVDRVVTNAGGEVRGLSDALRKAGIKLKDLNE